MKDKRINKKYQQLLLHTKFDLITTIDDTQTLGKILEVPMLTNNLGNKKK